MEWSKTVTSKTRRGMSQQEGTGHSGRITWWCCNSVAAITSKKLQEAMCIFTTKFAGGFRVFTHFLIAYCYCKMLSLGSACLRCHGHGGPGPSRWMGGERRTRGNHDTEPRFYTAVSVQQSPPGACSVFVQQSPPRFCTAVTTRCLQRGKKVA